MKEKSLAKNSIYYLVYQVLNVIFPFISGMYVARILLPDAIGKVSYAQNISSYFALLAFLGIPTYGLREISRTRQDKNELSKLYSELMLINTCSTTIFLLIYLVLILSVDSYRNNLSLYFITGGSIALNYLNNSWLFEGLEEFKFIALRNILFKVGNFFLLVFLVKGQEDYLFYAAITVLGTAGNYIFNMLYTPKFVRFTISGLNLKRHLKSIFTLLVVNLAIELYSLVDVTMLGIFSEDKNVAYYTYAQRIFRILLQVVNSFTIVIVPRMALYFKENKKREFNNVVSKTLEMIFVLSIPIIVGVQIVASDAVVLIYGKAFSNAAQTLQILSLIMIMSPIGYLLGSRMLLVTGHENQMVYCVTFGMVVNIIGNSILIPIYEQNGAAVASVVSELCVMLIYVWFGHKYYCLNNILPSFLKTIVSAAIMGFIIYLLGMLIDNLLVKIMLQVICAILTYFLLQFFLKENIVRQYGIEFIAKIKR